MNRRTAVLILLVALGLIAVLAYAVPEVLETQFNRVSTPGPYRASERAIALHRKLVIADLHADTLLWGRDLLKRGDIGHADVPRLVEGNVAIQAFTVTTKSPRGQNIVRNGDDSDIITYLAMAEHWPPATWNSLLKRALYQAERLQEAAKRSDGRLVMIRSAADLERFLAERKDHPDTVGGFLGLDGAHALEGDLNNVDVLFDEGFRMVGLTHFFDDEIAGSATGMHRGGLTEKGREFVRRAEAKQMIIDLAHASPATIDEVTAMATRPVIVSHTGVRGTCNNPRNLADSELKKIAATGGVISIGYWYTATCGTTPASVARAIRYTSKLVGVQHVALGSDFDGATTEPFDATGIVQITDALLKEGFSEQDITAIMGGNTIRVLRASLPK